jgi:hypothetical protein
MAKEALAMDRVARLLIALIVLGSLAVPLAAEPGEADRLLKQGFPDKDYSQSRIKVVVAGHRCVLAASGLEFTRDGAATVTDAAVVRVTVVADRDVVEVAEGRTALVTFDRPVRTAADLGKSKIVSIETPDGRVIRLGAK